MPKTTKKHYKLFVHECQRLVKLWGLKDWKIYYEHEEDKGSRGRIYTELQHHTATIRLSSEWESKPTKKGILSCARHEMIHLLTAYLFHLATCRYCTDSEIDTERERLARHLQSIIFPSKKGMCEL